MNPNPLLGRMFAILQCTLAGDSCLPDQIHTSCQARCHPNPPQVSFMRSVMHGLTG
jgi:hypothetical protein